MARREQAYEAAKLRLLGRLGSLVHTVSVDALALAEAELAQALRDLAALRAARRWDEPA